MPHLELRKRILITAFEAFDGRDKNASAEAVKALMQETIAANIELIVCLLPVETGTASKQMRCAIKDNQPDYVISLGEAKRDAICIETVAYNERKFLIPDNAGLLIDGTPVEPDGPASYDTTLPFEAMLHAIDRTGVPVRLSDDAGRYLCNEVMYSTLYDVARREALIPAGFIHVPHLPEAAIEPDYPSMPTEYVVRALLAVLGVLSGDSNTVKVKNQRTSENQSG
jgi:pyroglutamyl-peptidase